MNIFYFLQLYGVLIRGKPADLPSGICQLEDFLQKKKPLDSQDHKATNSSLVLAGFLLLIVLLYVNSIVVPPPDRSCMRKRANFIGGTIFLFRMFS